VVLLDCVVEWKVVELVADVVLDCVLVGAPPPPQAQHMSLVVKSESS